MHVRVSVDSVLGGVSSVSLTVVHRYGEIGHRYDAIGHRSVV